MTIAELKQYRNICVELAEVRSELKELQTVDAVQTASKFPYSKHTVPVTGLPPSNNVKSLQDYELSLSIQKQEIENYVNSIEDKEIRTIISLRYIRGKKRMSWQAIAMKLGYQSEHTPKNKLKKFFKIADFADFKC